MFSLGFEWIQIGDLKISAHHIIGSRNMRGSVCLYTCHGQMIHFYQSDCDYDAALVYHNSRKALPFDQPPGSLVQSAEPLVRRWVVADSQGDADRRWATFLQNRGEPIQAAHASTDCPINPSECDDAS